LLGAFFVIEFKDLAGFISSHVPRYEWQRVINHLRSSGSLPWCTRTLPPTDAGQTDRDAIRDFTAAVAEKREAGADRLTAVAAVARARPNLHAAFIAATNRAAR
jgi:hypothetical protein